MTQIETPQRIEPTRLEEISEPICDVMAGLSAESARLGGALHSRTAANLADLVRIMNTYYSNLIEGHNTRPRDIERALKGQFDQDKQRRNLQVEAAAHVHLQAEIDQMAREGTLPEPASRDFIERLHRDFYESAPPEMLVIGTGDRAFTMEPGKWRAGPEHDVEVGRHLPPSSERIEDS